MNNDIPVVKEFKYRGMIFGKKFTFVQHLNLQKLKFHKAIQLLKVLAHTDSPWKFLPIAKI